MSKLEIVGIGEVANTLGVDPDTVSQWHRRGHLPTPDAKLACGPIWRRATIERWRKGAGKQRVLLLQQL